MDCPAPVSAWSRCCTLCYLHRMLCVSTSLHYKKKIIIIKTKEKLELERHQTQFVQNTPQHGDSHSQRHNITQKQCSGTEC